MQCTSDGIFFGGISEKKNKPKMRKEIIWIPKSIYCNQHSILTFRQILFRGNFMQYVYFIFCQTWNGRRALLPPMFLILTAHTSGYSRNTHCALILLILAAEWFIMNVFIDNQFGMSMIQFLRLHPYISKAQVLDTSAASVSALCVKNSNLS